MGIASRYILAVGAFLLACIACIACASARDKGNYDASSVLDLAGVTDTIRVDAYLGVLEDCAGTLGIVQVEGLDKAGRFRGVGRNGASYGYSTCAYWLKLAFRESGWPQREWLAVIDNPRVDIVDMYRAAQPDAASVLRSGGQRKISERAVPSRSPAIPMGRSSTQTQTIYLRVQTTDVATFPVSLTHVSAFWQAVKRDEMVLGLYFGTLLLAALLNIFVFVHLRDPTYLVYVSTILCYALFQAASNAVDLEYLWPNRPAWNAVAIPLFCGLSLASYAVFAWQFLGLRERAPRFRSLVLALVALGGLIVVLALVGQISLAGFLGSIVAPIVAVGIGWMSVAAFVYGCADAEYFILGGLLQFLGVLLDGLHNLAILPTSFITTFGDQIGSAVFVVVFSLALTARFHTIQRKQIAAQRVAAEFSRKTTEAKLQALQARINPHFLFNTLTTIAGLVREAPERAEAVVLKLAKLFRYTLTATEREGRVNLTEELAIVRSYLEIEQARFGERLTFDICTEGAVESVTLPGLTLQPLVENCVMHGLRPKREGGRVRVLAKVGATHCKLTVEDDGIGMSPNRDSTGHGLASVRERLELAYGAASEMTLTNDSGLRIEIVVPMSDAT